MVRRKNEEDEEDNWEGERAQEKFISTKNTGHD